MFDKMPSFIWQGKDSYEDYGIVITVLPPETIPEANVDEIPIPGRDGDLTIDYNTKKPYTLPMTCTLLDFAKIDEVKAWLNGSGDLIFNWQNYIFDARLINQIDISQSLESLGEFPLIWKVQPYKRDIDSLILILEAPQTIFNPSTQNSKPVIKLYGTGNVNLIINGNIINLTNVSEYVTIDSDIQNAFKDTLPKNNDMEGEFQELISGTNYISWTGSVAKIEITPNWRYL